MMKLKQLATAIGVTALLGLAVSVADPAAAATGSWRAYGTVNPITSSADYWACGPTDEFDTDVYAQACAVRSSSDNRKVRMAIIVKNNRPSLYGAEAAAVLRDDDSANLGRWECGRSGVGANGTRSVCFGAWVNSPYPSWVRTTVPGVNGQPLVDSGGV